MSPTTPLRYRGPGWFQGCPVTKLLCFTCISLFVVFKSNTDSIALDYENVVGHGEFYRFFTFMLTFSSLGELLLGLVIFIPLSKRFEREYGSEGFLRVLIKSTILATIIMCFFLSGKYLATGIYPVIGTLLHLYKSFTPRLHPKFISILGFDFSEKALTYIFALQLMGNQGVASAIPFGSGYLAGWLVTHPYSPFHKIYLPIPKFLYNIGHGIGKATGLEDLSHAPSYVPAMTNHNMYSSTTRASNGSSSSSLGMGMGMGMGMMRARSMGTGIIHGHPGRRPPLVPGAPLYQDLDSQSLQHPTQQQQEGQLGFEAMPIPDPPSPDAIETLTAMGFDRDAVIRALRLSDNNVEHAANRLLSGI